MCVCVLSSLPFSFQIQCTKLILIAFGFEKIKLCVIFSHDLFSIFQSFLNLVSDAFIIFKWSNHINWLVVNEHFYFLIA